MKHINSYYDFLKEELVYGKNLSKQDGNFFASIFNSDPLKLREFIQGNLHLQNLKFLAGGGIGLAFEWKDKILKFTTDNSEKIGVEKMMALAPDEKLLPGFAKYYWIKEIDLPRDKWKKTTFELTVKELDNLKKKRRGESSDSLTGDQIETRKKMDRIKKAYIICLEKLRMLDQDEDLISMIICNLMSKNRKKVRFLDPEKDNTEKLKSIWKWIQSDQVEFKDPEFVKLGMDKMQIWSNDYLGLNKSAFGDDFIKSWSEIGLEKFLDISKKILKIYYTGEKLGIPTGDMKGDNMGWRGDELVAFDCM